MTLTKKLKIAVMLKGKKMSKSIESRAKMLCEKINLANYNYRGTDEILVRVEDLNTLKHYISLLEGRILGLEKVIHEKTKQVNNLTARHLQTYQKLQNL
jgi:hypothetical protein